MKDSQLVLEFLRGRGKYIKESNERFSTVDVTPLADV